MLLKTDVYVGFDSAWTDKITAPGAICAVVLQDGKTVAWHSPRLARFEEARAFIHDIKSADGVTLIALDQPTLVPNAACMRPVERVAASVLSGCVQGAHTGRIGMFCANSPIWPFLKAVGAVQDPERARMATEDIFLIEVFPALALRSFDDSFAVQGGAPKYNPANRKTYKPTDWLRVTAAVAREAGRLGCPDLAAWCCQAGEIAKPRKADQDRLDAGICLAIALRWRLRPRAQSIMIGDLETGYMISPASETMRHKLVVAAAKMGNVPLDTGAEPSHF